MIGRKLRQLRLARSLSLEALAAEMGGIVNKYNIGLTTDTNDPQKLAYLFKEMIGNQEERKIWKQNLKEAAKELCWENEEKKLLEIYSDVISQ